MWKLGKVTYLLISILAIGISNVYAQRVEIPFNKQWKFIMDVDQTEFSQKDFDASKWTTLDVPHDWSFNKGVRTGGDQKQGGGYHDGGIGWYRKTFLVNKTSFSKITYVNFDGVYMNSEVWVNGTSLGKRPYGYISFRYDISKYLVEGENSIAVRVDNSLEPSARWYHPCGIYAAVQLVEVHPVHILPNSVFVTTPEITPARGKVNVKVDVSSAKTQGNGLQLEASIVTLEGKSIASTLQTIEDNSKALSVNLEIEKPLRWSPDTPNLYVVKTKIILGDKTIDEIDTRFGFRTVEWNKDTGFWLNGNNLKLKGVCEHWEGGPVGGAWTKPMLRWKLNLLKEMGINAIRPSHNPTPPMFYDICDEIGLLVMDEIFDGWHKKAPQDYGKQAFSEWWQRDITEWITRDRNHPSIFVYSLGNETHSDIAPELVEFSRNLDPTRLYTSGAGNSEDMDIIGVNGGSETQAFIENKRFTKPFISTEAPHTWQTRGYYRTQTWWRDNVLPGTYELPNLTEKEIFFYEGLDPKKWKNRKQRFNSSYDNATVRISARKSWEQVRDNPWISGHFRWTGFDYYGEAGLVHGGLPFNLFMGGALDVAGFKKDLFYFYQSQWTTEPMVHVLPHWTHPRMEKGTIIPVWVYSNAEEVELFFNGQSLGKDKPGTVWNEMQCEWMVPYQEGTLEAVAYNGGKEVKRTQVSTSVTPSKLSTEVTTIPAEDNFNASYIITSQSKDNNNQLYPYGENRVYYKLYGDIQKVSMENGNPIDPTSRTKSDYRNMFFGKTRLFVQQKEEQSGAIVTASILGDKALYLSNIITIDADQINLFGKSKKLKLKIKYTTNGTDPRTEGKVYKEAFTVEDGTLVKAIVMHKNDVLISMEERFGKTEGLFWGNEHSADIWIGRGINIGAEVAELEGEAKVRDDAYRYKGEGFVAFDDKEGAITWFKENDGEAGDFSIRFRYMHNNVKQLHPMKLFVNGEYIKTFEFNPTGGWEKEWKFVTTIVNFKEGANEIRLETTGEGGPYIDELFVD
ncbi:glycoside hydrolase family 2 TIM barrel-domain containing protein [Flammeovirga pacifica]|uniref:Beta-galactosidase n=1 Tax=Flammeovirga pacifica TaxID=915059 RepID=A0A1S1YU34_FLAPC|nr:glycoside hydrolase family 2 TIM barrel-domain containing protein [Flammeovirga pacifica]OHX64516.1 beta-galactosidase [Flammeovirga pacifica]